MDTHGSVNKSLHTSSRGKCGGTERSITDACGKPQMAVKRFFSEIDTELPNVEDRQVEVKLVGQVKSIDVVMMFENFPVWLVGLEPSRIRHIHILGYLSKNDMINSFISRDFQVEIVICLLSRFGAQRVLYHLADTFSFNDLLILVSGSLTYVNSVVSSFGAPDHNRIIGVVDHHFYGRLRKGRPSGIVSNPIVDLSQWTRIRHESVGGVSTFVALFCSVMKIDPVVTTLQRTLQHVVDYGVRPKCIRESDSLFQISLTLKDRIHPAELDRTIVYATHFCCSGWGVRRLNPGELGQV
jgi:hypothetical protein